MFNLYLKNPENILFSQEKFKSSWKRLPVIFNHSLNLLKACMIE